MSNTTSAQFNSLITSNNGTNVQSKLVCSSHFFIEGTNYTQSQVQAFGPQSTQQFRTTSAVALAGPTKIYSICSGFAFIQPQTGTTDKVNLILRPFKQPVPGVSIKFFIYRGLNKSDFIASGSNDLAPKLTTGFTEHIWTEFEDFYQNDIDPLPTFHSSLIGIPDNILDQPSTNLIESYFNKITPIINETTNEEDPDYTYEFPIIPKGIHLSTVSTEVGLDIVLNNGDYFNENDNSPFRLDLEFARATEGVIETSNESDSQVIRVLKEASQLFIDVAAFYGLHTNGTGSLTVDNSMGTPLTTKTDIYTRMGGFYTKNRLYVYIQSNRQRSYNYYGNYDYSETNSNDFTYGEDENSLTETKYAHLEWPIFIYDGVQSIGTEENTLTIQLTSDGNWDGVLYIRNGVTTSRNKNGFFRNNNLYFDLSTPNGDPIFTRPIQFSFPSDGANTITGLIQLIYEGKKLKADEYFAPSGTGNDPDPLTLEIKDIDDTFNLIEASSFEVPQNEFQLPSIINENLRLITVSMLANKFKSAAVRIRKVLDKVNTVDEFTYIDRLTYETIVDTSENETTGFTKTESLNIETRSSGVINFKGMEQAFFNPKLPYFIEKVIFVDETRTITGIQLSAERKVNPRKKIIGITSSENDYFKTLIDAENLTNTCFFFKEYLTSEEEFSVDTNGIRFKRFSLKIVAEDYQGNLKIYSPAEEVRIYTLDQNFFFSNQYSANIPGLVNEYDDNNLFNDNTRI